MQSVIKARPTLFNEFFHLLITWSNEVIDYIKTTNDQKKNTPRKHVTYYLSCMTSNIIAKSFKKLFSAVSSCVSNFFKSVKNV